MIKVKAIPTNLEQARMKLLAGVKVARDKGFTLVMGYWGNEAGKHKCGNPLACLLAANDKSILRKDLLPEILGVNSEWLRSFSYGYDGVQLKNPIEEAYNLGREFCEKFSPQHYGDFLESFDKKDKK